MIETKNEPLHWTKILEEAESNRYAVYRLYPSKQSCCKIPVKMAMPIKIMERIQFDSLSRFNSKQDNQSSPLLFCQDDH